MFRILKEMGVTAVVNCGQGELAEWNYVNTGPAYYKVTRLVTVEKKVSTFYLK